MAAYRSSKPLVGVRFLEVAPKFALVGELVYPPDLGSGFCQFESDRGHQMLG